MTEAVQTRQMVLMFTDLVGSSDLKVKHGDATYAHAVARPHNTMFRQLLKLMPGARELSYTGDGFFAAFESVKDAVTVALQFHFALRSYPWKAAAPLTRIGVHVGQVVTVANERGENEQVSHAADMCARLMSLGQGGQTLLTRHAFDDARQYVREHPEAPEGLLPDGASVGNGLPAVQWLAHGRYRFKGKDEDPLEVFEVGAEGLAPLSPPPDSEKARRALSAEEEATLGWRPAIGLEIPGRANWRVEKKLGEGGFGEVWLARRGKTNEPRVFKFCYDAERVRSFKRELALFRLLREELGDRPDIARLIEVRLDQPPFFLESDYIESGNLAQWAESKGGIDAVPLSSRLKLVAGVARAVAAAHSLGVIHKDIKPSNIFIREFKSGEPQPLLADFGIGAVTDLGLLKEKGITIDVFTQTLAQQGGQSTATCTLMYAPPELLLGKQATTAWDIYALGVMLWQVVIGDLERPLGSEWDKRIDDDILREDIRGCVADDPRHRFASAAELADRLERIDERREERRAKEAAAAEQLATAARAAAQQRRLRAMKTGLMIAGVFLVAVGGLAVLSFVEWRAAAAARATAAAEADRATHSDYANRISLAEIAIGDDNVSRARDLLEGCPPGLRNWEWARLEALLDVSVATLDLAAAGAPAGGNFAVAVSPDGRRLVCGSNDGVLRVWDLAAGKVVLSLRGHEKGVTGVAFSADGRRIASGSYDATVRVWDAQTGGESVHVLRGHRGPVNVVVFTADGNRVLSGGDDGTVKVWDALRGGEPLMTRGHDSGVASVAVSPDGSRIAAGVYQDTITLWDAGAAADAGAAPLMVLRGHDDRVDALVFSSDGARLFSGSRDESLKVWDAAGGGAALLTFYGHERGVNAIALSPDGSHVASASNDRLVKVWDATREARALVSLHGHQKGVTSVVYSPDGRVISAGRDRAIKVWDPARGDEAGATLKGHTAGVNAAVFSPDGARVASAGDDGMVRLWDVARRAEIVPALGGAAGPLTGVAFSPDGRQVAAAGADGKLRLWDAQARGEPRLSIDAHTDIVMSVAFSPDSARVVTAGRDGTVKLWDAQRGQAVRTFEGHEGWVFGAAFSPDGARIASAGADHTIRVWDAGGKGKPLILRGHDASVFCVAFSPDGQRLVSSGYDDTVRIWDARREAKPLRTLRGHEKWVNFVSFSPDGRRVLSGSEDATLKLWDAQRGGEPLITLRSHDDTVNAGGFSPDGRRVVSAGADHTVRLWDTK